MHRSQRSEVQRVLVSQSIRSDVHTVPVALLSPPSISLSLLTHCSSRQQEIEEKLIEEETARRVEELVAKRVEEELEKRKDEIEREVLRRVEEAKRIMEKQLLEELERQRQAELAAQKAREVTLGRLESPYYPAPAGLYPLVPTSPSETALPLPPDPIPVIFTVSTK